MIFIWSYRISNQSMQKQNELSVSGCVKAFDVMVSLDCVKLCPGNPQLWAFSYYQQVPEFCGGIEVLETQQLSLLSTKMLKLGPIMHIQWLEGSPQPQNQLLLAAHRQQKISICTYNHKSKQLSLTHSLFLGSNMFCLYCDWIFNRERNLIQIATSTSQSTVYQLEYSKSEQPQIIAQYQKHEYAVWACRFSSDAKYLISGDEVNTLYMYDTENKMLVCKNSKAHEQGISEIIRVRKCNEQDPQQILSGSFDGSIALISLNNFGAVLKKYTVHGTIWRIIPASQHHCQGYWLICNSSENKFLIGKIDDKNLKVIWTSGQQHQSLAYAADWNKTMMITVSYYDKKVRIWNYSITENMI